MVTDRDLLLKLRNEIDAQLNTPACASCEHYKTDSVDHVCEIVNQHIPPHVLDVGCERYLREVPF